MAQRRLVVSEADAQRRLRWLAGLVVAVMLAGLTLAVFRSSWLAIDRIDVHGATRADVAAALATADVRRGVPTIGVDPGAIEAALLEDPWVAKADVSVTWPRTVEITVLEHQPVGWVKAKNGWLRMSAAGTVLERGEPTGAQARVTTGGVGGRIGSELQSEPSLAAVDFLSHLSPTLRRDAVVRGDSGGLTATIAGHRIDLGAPDRMAEKAAALIGLLDQDLPDGARISLVAPSRPGVIMPKDGAHTTANAESESQQEVETR